ncbi:MAG: phosphosulfolactate synthase [Candidatus Diapherotrites archaeon]|nr:phosphosulfolactate synthase [Candidatus Diapherotrites archaeon]
MGAKPFGHISLPPRSEKPRENGVTMVLDHCLGMHAVEDLLATAGDYIDVVKLGWGTSRLFDEGLLKEKIRAYKANGIKVCPGGTFLEVACAQGKQDEFFNCAKALGFDCVEVSNGVHPMHHDEKLELIRKACSMGFCVTSEVGKKLRKEDERIAPEERVSMAEKELAAGSWKVIIEARAGGTLGMFDFKGNVKEELAGYLIKNLETDKIIFEAPNKSQQAWLIKRLGSEANLGNIKPDDVIPLETLRVGLRGDTFAFFHLG